MNKSKEFQISEGSLVNETHRITIKSIDAIFYETGGRLGWFKYVAGISATTLAVSSTSGGFLAPLAVGMGGVAYMMHQTRYLYAVVNGEKIELACQIYLPGLWNDEESSEKFQKVIELVNKEK